MSPQDEPRKIDLSWDLPYPPAKVWRALTEPELISQWLMPADFKPQVGHRFTFKGEANKFWDGVVQSEVLEVEQGRRLVYVWGAASVGLDTRLTWTLTPIQGGTRLSLEHSGFKSGNRSALEGARQGWERNVSQRMGKLLAELT